MAYSKNYNNPDFIKPSDIRRDGLTKMKKLKEREAAHRPKKRKFTKAQKEWMKQYSALCFGLEPMYMDDYINGECSFEDLKRGNIRWTRDHFDEVIANLERL